MNDIQIYGGMIMTKKVKEYQKEKYNWEFLFLGRNIDAVQTAGTFGINADRAVTYQPDSVETRTNFAAKVPAFKPGKAFKDLLK